MASYSDVWVSYDTLKTIMHNLEIKENKGQTVKGLGLTVALSDEFKEFKTKDGKEIRQNVAVWVSQSEEQRQKKKEKFYVANGKTFWSNGSQKTVQEMGNQEPQVTSETVNNNTDSDGDIPF